MVTEALAKPSLQKGWEIFTSRPLSLIFTLIFAVVICVISFFLLTFPVIAGYGYAIRQSRREEYFIDLNAILRTISHLFQGIKRYFGQSYVFGFLGILPTVILFFIPIIPIMISTNQEAFIMSLVLEILWIPTFFLAGAFMFYGYPHLVATNRGKDSIRYAFSMGKSKPLATMGKGFLLIFPFPGWIIHFFMIFSYPILASWAIASTDDPVGTHEDTLVRGQVTFAKLFLTLLLAGAMFCIIYFFAWWWGSVGFFIGLGISLFLAIIFASRISR
ncbi:MAG: hypothetical protein PVH84_16305 [Candidatus Aminicenantes bacterium]